MKLIASLKVSVDIKENENLTDATERVLETLIDVVDEWINADGPNPYIKIEMDIPDEMIEETKNIN